jgi:hypothetical protein
MPVTGHPPAQNRAAPGRPAGARPDRSHRPGEYGKRPSRLELLEPLDRHPSSVSPSAPRRAGLLALLVAAMLGGGCGHKIGDPCSNSADCDPSGGSRTCDLSQPGGYCIIDGCDARSCPSDSVCGRFFPDQQFLGVTACDPANPAAACMADEVCLADANLAAGASCVRASLEKRACVQSCGNDGDCRGGYVCRPFGICGTAALTLNPTGKFKFCTPAPPAAATGLCPLD